MDCVDLPEPYKDLLIAQHLEDLSGRIHACALKSEAWLSGLQDFAKQLESNGRAFSYWLEKARPVLANARVYATMIGIRQRTEMAQFDLSHSLRPSLTGEMQEVTRNSKCACS